MKDKFKNNKGFVALVIIVFGLVLIIISIGIYVNFYRTPTSENVTIQNKIPQESSSLPILDLSKAKKIDKLVDGYLVVIEMPIVLSRILQENENITLEPASYLAIVPNLDEKITEDNISILASYKNRNDFNYTIYGNDIYYIDTLNSFSDPGNDGIEIPLYEEQSVYKLNLTEMESKKLLTNKLKKPTYDLGDSQFIRRLIFNDSKMFFVTNSVLYEYDLNKGKSDILINLPKKKGAMLGVDEALGPNIIEKIENNKLLLDFDPCPFIEKQGGCNPGGYQLSYNLINKELKAESFNPEYRESVCNVTKIENGKLITVTYDNPLETEECQKKFKIIDSYYYSNYYSVQDPFIQRK